MAPLGIGQGLGIDLLRLSQQAEATQARRSQIEDELVEVDAQLEEMQERRATGEALNPQWLRKHLEQRYLK